MTQKRESLALSFKKVFAPAVRSRGEYYFFTGRVSEPIFSQGYATMRVKGSHVYQVKVDLSELETLGHLSMECSCPHYEQGEPCKHLWASLLKLDFEGIGTSAAPKVHVPAWLEKLSSIQKASLEHTPFKAQTRVQKNRLAYYGLNLHATRKAGLLSVNFFEQILSPEAQPKPPKAQGFSMEELALYSEPLDREILAMLYKVPETDWWQARSKPRTKEAVVPAALQESLLVRLAATQRFFIAGNWGTELPEPLTALSFDSGEAWRLGLTLGLKGESYKIEGLLIRGDEQRSLDEPLLCLRSGLVIFSDHIARLDAQNCFAWISALRDGHLDLIPQSDAHLLVEKILADKNSPEVFWPEELRWPEETSTPQLKVVFDATLSAELRFRYDDQEVSAFDQGQKIVDQGAKRVLIRDKDAENLLAQKATEVTGVEEPLRNREDVSHFRVRREAFPQVVSELIALGAHVEAEGRKVQSASHFDVEVKSSKDWFDLRGAAHFENGQSVELPALLKALEHGEKWVVLGDGSHAMLPVEWLKTYAPLAAFAHSDTNTSESLRFKRAQMALLGRWVEDDKNLKTDADFKKFMKLIGSQEALKPVLPSRSFQGSLRPYQQEGLAWLRFLEKTGFCGILADDMGLGKTIQVLAHLEAAHQKLKAGERRPSLVVVPKSLIFNWQEEAARFAPRLKVLALAGAQRAQDFDKIATSDLVLVSYPTLRLDIEEFLRHDFYYAVLDEAQTIKNADSQVSEACRRIRAQHRLALTGTPVENSIEDLFSILNFLNPGLIGNGVKSRMLKAASLLDGDPRALEKFSRALGPFLLRRTKEQVLKELPEKTEIVLNCELSAADQRNYDELKRYYQQRLTKSVSEQGIARSKFVVLEALLRLRQASCHPGLIKKTASKASSAKLELLLEKIQDLEAKGHKMLVFSQFTSFLDIVEARLKKEKISFERLDGKTSLEDRREKVERFQSTDEVSVFLISLKAGGVGLNLTAADYVFILDPWWNPAAESQAVDRSHRIGQKNKVIAFRLITKGSVEEKIVELQKTKKNLASALIAQEASLLKTLTQQDIQLLLS